MNIIRLLTRIHACICRRKQALEAGIVKAEEIPMRNAPKRMYFLVALDLTLLASICQYLLSDFLAFPFL